MTDDLRMVLGTVGLPGSAKSTAAKIAEEMGIVVITGGDIVRNEVEARGLPLTDKISAKVTDELRGQYGEFVLAEKCIEAIEQQSSPEVLVDSFRNVEEVNRFQE